MGSKFQFYKTVMQEDSDSGCTILLMYLNTIEPHA
jgi:hypothetical protein